MGIFMQNKMSKQEKIDYVKQKLAKLALKKMSPQERIDDAKKQLAKVAAWLEKNKHDTTKIDAAQTKLSAFKG